MAKIVIVPKFSSVKLTQAKGELKQFSEGLFKNSIAQWSQRLPNIAARTLWKTAPQKHIAGQHKEASCYTLYLIITQQDVSQCSSYGRNGPESQVFLLSQPSSLFFSPTAEHRWQAFHWMESSASELRKQRVKAALKLAEY